MDYVRGLIEFLAYRLSQDFPEQQATDNWTNALNQLNFRFGDIAEAVNSFLDSIPPSARARDPAVTLDYVRQKFS